MLFGPTGHAAEHLDSLTNIMRLMSDDEFRYEASTAHNSSELTDALERFQTRTIHREGRPERPITPGLTYTGRLFGGLLGDIRRRAPHYISDLRDGLTPKCVSSTLFLFFACLAPAVTFGGVMAVETAGQIGAVEMLIAGSVCGVVFALLSGNPLIILGGTGPLLVFTAILYRLSSDLQIPFLPSYAWVGLWTSGFLILLAINDASCLMQHFTRFTDEIFAALVSLIFIYEAINGLVRIFDDLEVKRHHDTALLSLLLGLGTFYVAISLSRFRRSRYLLPQIREFLADFGPTLALAAMTLASVWLHEVYLDELPAPDTFGPSLSGRDWLIDPFAAPRWVWFASAGPAVLATVLIYLNHNITARLVNSPDHRLKKGEGYHLDLLVVGGLVGACSMFGLPWLTGAIVRSLNHVRSLASAEEVVDRNGDTRERIIHVRENRLTGLAIHLLLGLSLCLLPVLKIIPMATLFGLFLYMGVVSISGNQFFERLSLWLMDRNLYPSTYYLRRVPKRTIHKFTLLQAMCLGALWIVKASALGILFPLFIALLAPVRMLANRCFRPEHLAVLDAVEDPDQEETRWR